MKRKNTTRNALFTSVVSLLLCVSMLVGATFAWFTDSVESGRNVIAAGNLDVELYNDGGRVDESTKLFNDVNGEAILWEPGAVAYENLQVKNVGDLALRYQLNLTVLEETVVNGYKLSDVIMVGVVKDGIDSSDRNVVIGDVESWTKLSQFSLNMNGKKLDGHTDDDKFGIVLYWQPNDNDVDNRYNMNNDNQGKVLKLEIGVNLFATQVVEENDSFDNTYDAAAPWTGEVGTVPAEKDGAITITSAAELAALAADVNSGNTYEGKTVKLGANIDLNDIPWTPIGNSAHKFNGTFIGTGYTISNLYVTGTKGVGLFGYTWTSTHIEGVTIDGAYVSGNDYVGAVLGNGYLSANCIKNCTVMNAEIYATPYLMDDGMTYDGGAKAGAVAGSAYNGNLTGNKAVSCSVTAYRDLGGIAGMLYADGVTGRTVTASDNEVDTVTLKYFNLNGAAYADGKVNENMGDTVGRIGRSSEACNLPVVENNKATNVTRDTLITWIENGVRYNKDVDAGEVTLVEITDAFTGEMLNVPTGVTALRNKLLNGNTTIKEVVIPVTLTNFGGKANADGKGASGGFFYRSAVEKVVLPEGMTQIPVAAFNQAANLTSVNIPSTVKKIGINAFAGTGLTELVVPATVEEIGYGAFRDMSNLTTVTIEGDDVYIPGYAFRSCPKLETVYILGENVTFASGDMIFTYYDHNNDNPNGITVYVCNDTVKASLEANSTFNGNIVVMNAVSEDENIADSLTDGADTVYLPAGKYTFPASNLSEGDVVICTEGVVFEGKTGLNINGATVVGATFTNDNDYLVNSTTINGTFKNCVFTNSDGLRYCYAGETVVFENCVFDTDFYGIHFDGGANDVIFNGCTFTGFNTFGGAITKLTMEDCTFKYNGKGGYNGVNLWGDSELINCTFVFDGSASNEWIDLCNDGKTVTFTNCVVTDGETEKGVETFVGNYGTGNTITIDDVPYASSNDMLTAAVANGATKVMLADGEYDLSGNQKDGLNLVGIGNGVKVANTTKYASGKAVGAIWQAVNLENMTITNTVYTMADGGKSTFTNVNFAAGFRQGYGTGVVFNECTFGSNTEGYALHFQTDSASEGGLITLNGCDFQGGKVHLGGKRAYAFTGCEFAEGTDFQVWSNITLDNCTVNGEKVTAENVATYFPNLDTAKVTFK